MGTKNAAMFAASYRYDFLDTTNIRTFYESAKAFRYLDGV